MEKINGYEFASRILHCPQGGIDALLQCSGNDESCWLELKAGMALRPEDQKKGEKPEDLYWNITKAVIEIANTSGGILLIGIEDRTHTAVALEDNDPRKVIQKEGLEAYRRREILERIWPEKKVWRSRGNTWSIDENVPADLVSVWGWNYQGKDIAIVLIKPAEECIRVWKNGEVEQILSRCPGEVGKKQEMIGSRKMAEYEEKREIASEFFAMLYQNFLASAQEKENAAVINKKIADYYEWFEKRIRERQHFDFAQFTSLDASGNIEEFEDDFMAPEACEIDISESDDWLDEESPEKFDIGGTAERKERLGMVSEHRSGDLIGLMQEIPRLIILGEPGGGKTTTLMKFVTLFKDTDVLTVFIPMGQWVNGGSLAGLIGKLTNLEVDQWAALIRQKRLRLVIDAVNECPDQFRKAALLDIENFLLQNPEIPALISSRTDADLKKFRMPFFSIQKMDETHQLDYLTRYSGDPAKAQAIFNKLKSFSGGEEIAANPMLLRMVFEVFKKQNDLPSGRAGLYHKWLEQWYKRESGKARNAGEKLSWTFEETLEILSELALQSRLQGYRDVPLDIAEKILQKYGKEALVQLCQGPVVIVDGEFVRFRHETFQEYLCAEKLVREPELLKLDSRRQKENAIQWGMPLAYAVELCWPLPEPLWRAAWAADPWLGVAVTDKKRTEALLNKTYPGPMPEYRGKTLDLSNGYDDQTALIHQALWRIFLHLNDGLLFRSELWYGPEQYLSYLLTVNKEIAYNWGILELWQLINCESLFTLCKIMRRALTLKVKKEENGILLPLPERIRISDIFIENEIPPELGKEPFLRHYQFTEISLHTALEAINLGLCQKEDFSDQIPQWIEVAEPFYAEQMINCNLAIKEDFSDKIHQWIRNVNPYSAGRMVRMGLASKEDFADEIPRWTQNASQSEIMGMLRTEVLSKEDVADQIIQWINAANIYDAEKMMQYGLATKADFADHISRWIADAGVCGACQLIDRGFAAQADFTDHISRWIADADIFGACQLIDRGFATQVDFTDHISRWIADADILGACQLIDRGFATQADFAGHISRWIKKAGLDDAVLMIKLGWAVKADFSEKITQWIKEAGAEKAKKMLDYGLATRADFSEKFSRWIRTANLRDAEKMIKYGLASREDFSERIACWIKNADPKDAEEIIKDGFSCKKDFSEMIASWIRNGSPDDIVRMMNSGLAAKADFINQIPRWNTLSDIQSMLMTKVVSKNDLAGLISQWIEKATPEEGRHMIFLGLACEKDFADKDAQWLKAFRNSDQ